MLLNLYKYTSEIIQKILFGKKVRSLAAASWAIAQKIEIDEEKCFNGVIFEPQCGNHLGNVWLMHFFSPLLSINFPHALLHFWALGWLSGLPPPIWFGSSPLHTIPTTFPHQFLLLFSISEIICRVFHYCAFVSSFIS